MIVGWAGSLQSGWLYEDGSLENFAQSGDVNDIVWTDKGYRIMVSFICLAFLVFVQIPWLGLIYTCSSGLKAHRDLPYHYLRLLLLVTLTWPCFGIWWFLSSEGEGIIHDTKANTFGFCLLNIVSKGGFTLMMLKLSRDHRSMWIEDCAVTPKAKNQDLWIVKQLRPYDPSESSHDKKFTEADLTAAVARALAQQAQHNVNAQEQSNPFGLSRQTSPEDPQMTAELSLKGSKSAAAFSASRSNHDLPTLLDSSSGSKSEKLGQNPIAETQAPAPAQVSQQDWWPCNCDRKPPVNVQYIEDPRLRV